MKASSEWGGNYCNLHAGQAKEPAGALDLELKLVASAVGGKCIAYITDGNSINQTCLEDASDRWGGWYCSKQHAQQALEDISGTPTPEPHREEVQNQEQHANETERRLFGEDGADALLHMRSCLQQRTTDVQGEAAIIHPPPPRQHLMAGMQMLVAYAERACLRVANSSPGTIRAIWPPDPLSPPRRRLELPSHRVVLMRDGRLKPKSEYIDIDDMLPGAAPAVEVMLGGAFKLDEFQFGFKIPTARGVYVWYAAQALTCFGFACIDTQIRSHVPYTLYSNFRPCLSSLSLTKQDRR